MGHRILYIPKQSVKVGSRITGTITSKSTTNGDWVALRLEVKSIYKFNETSGTVINDHKGNYNLNVVGTGVLLNQTGLLDKSIYIPGTGSSYISGVSPTAACVSGKMTISVWVNFAELNLSSFQNKQVFVESYGLSINIVGSVNPYQVEGNGQFFAGAGNALWGVASPLVTTGNWHLLIARFDAAYSNDTLYVTNDVDGLMETIYWGLISGQVNGSFGGGSLALGRSLTWNNTHTYAKMYVCDMRIWNRVLKSNELKRLFNYRNGVDF